MTGSPLVDWAFGEAAGASGPEFTAFLQMRERLRRAQCRGEGVAEALGAMDGIGRWGRLYCAFDLCRCLYNGESAVEVAVARRILIGLVAGEDHRLARVLEEAVRDAAARSAPTEIVRSLQAAAARWQRIEDPSGASDRLDYSDVEIFAGPTLILALATTVAQSDGTVRVDDGALARLAATALSGGYGRLAFRLAIEWAIARPALFDQDEVNAALQSIPRKAMLLSPDILSCLVRWTFLQPSASSDQADPATLFGTLQHELIGLAVFRRWFDMVGSIDLGLVYWQDAVMALMLDLDLEAAARILATFWTPRIHHADLHAVVTVPLAVVPKDLAALLGAAWLPAVGRPRGALDIRADTNADLAGTWPILSPWLAERTWTKQETTQRLRWLCGLAIDARILESRSFDRISRPFTAHLLSGLPQLWRYARFSQHREISAWRADVTPTGHLGWLSRQMCDAGLEALGGEGMARCPDILSVLDDVCAKSFFIPGVEREMVGNGLDGLRRRMTTGALHLLEDAIAATTTSAWSPWLDHADAVIALHAGEIGAEFERQGGEGVDPPDGRSASGLPDDVIAYGLLRRYLAPASTSPSFVDERVLTEIRAANDGTGSWDISARRLLLAPTRDAAAWFGSNDDRGEPSLHIRLARALMRATAASDDPDAGAALTARWKTDLDQVLREITDPVPFDRFVRLKLIRMLADGMFDADEVLQLLAVKTLLQYGGPFHVEAVRSVLADREGEGLARVRAALFLALSRRALNRRGELDPEVFPLKEKMLEQLRAACLCADRNSLDYAIVEARDLEKQALQDNSQVTTVKAAALGSGFYAMVSIPDGQRWMAPATAEMVAIDPTSAQAAIVHRKRREPGDRNAFAGGEALGPARHLGVVERVSGGPGQVDIRFAPRLSATAPALGTDLRIGDLVLVDSADARLGRRVQQAIGARRIERLDRQDRQSGLTTITVEQAGDRPPRALARSGAAKVADWTRDTFNFAGLHGLAGTTYPVRTISAADGVLMPATLGFADLILDYPTLADGQPLTLSIHGVTRSEAGDLDAIVFEVRPFERYRIWIGLGLAPETREILARELDRLHDLAIESHGLLLTVTLFRTAQGPVLRHVEAPVPPFLAPEDPTCPLDCRNLVWRDLFSGRLSELGHAGADPAARSHLATSISRRRYVLDLLVAPGLPAQIHATLDEPCEEPSAFLDLDPASWKPWEAEIFGAVTAESSLRLPENEEDRAAAVRRVAALKTGQAVRLRRVANIVRDDGRLYGFTDFNLPLLVNAETISLVPSFDPGLSFRPGRMAVLSYFAWRASEFRVQIDRQEIPQSALSGAQARAIMTRFPPLQEGRVTCWVAWLDAEGPGISEGPLNLDVRRVGRRLPAGTMIEVSVTVDEARIRLFEPFAIADAIWSQDTVPLPTGAFVGTVEQGGIWSDVHETAPGRFALCQSDEATLGARAALRRQLDLQGGEDEIAVTDLTRDRSRDLIWGSNARRCALQSAKGVLAGTTTSEHVGGPFRLSGAQLAMIRVPDGWLLDRRFQILRYRLSSTPRSQPDLPAARDVDDQAPAIAAGDVVSGRFDPRTGTLHLAGALKRRYPSGVGIPMPARQRAPILPGMVYPDQQARARILNVDPLVGSFVDAPESSLESLALDLQAARNDDRSPAIDPGALRLIFAGREETIASPDGEPLSRYVFEWGYGRWIGLAEDQVWYDGGPIRNAGFVLFYGDRISAGDVTEHGLSIESIAQSRAHVLYRQSLKHRVVNLLRVVMGRNDEPRIESITGFDPDTEHQAVGGALPYARLDPEGLSRVRERLETATPQRLLARLDTDLFEASLGQTLQFNFRRLDLDDTVFGIAPGDRTFVVAGEIRRWSSDVGLTIRDPGLHPEDVASSFLGRRGGTIMLRRSFSIRQQTLGDILELEGADRLEDNTLLVRVDRRGISLVDGTIPRSPEVVRQKVRQGDAVLGVFGSADARAWRFELSPGVMVDLAPAEIAWTGSFYRGDVVVLQSAADQHIAVTLASPSDLRFVPEGRPAVLLPRNSLARPEALPPYRSAGAQAAAHGAFSVGDLPDLAATARQRRADGTIEKMSKEKFAAFMCTPHPKIGTLYFLDRQNPENGLCFTPGNIAGDVTGRLSCAPISAAKRFGVVVAELGDRPIEHPTDWYLLSYADVSAAKLYEQARTREKRFHDSETTVWTQSDEGGLQAGLVRVPPLKAITGPLFFSLRPDRSAILRRPVEELRAFAGGSSQLFAMLARSSDRRRGSTVTVAATGTDYLFVELSPGQIVLLHAGILHARTPVGHLPLRELDYSQLAAGDELRLIASEASDSLTLMALDASWTQGPRNAFGPYGAILERSDEASSAEDGVACYGVGNVTVRLPTQDVAALPPLAIIGGNSAVAKVSRNQRDLRETSILLTLDVESDRIGVHGLPDARFAPSRNWPWQEDPLFRATVREVRGAPVFDMRELAMRLRRAGGAMLFTVERSGSGTGMFLALSRRYQEVRPIDGKLVRAVIEGQVGTAPLVQLRVGARHLAVPAAALLPGVLEEELAPVLASLGAAGHEVWLRGGNGTFAGAYGEVRDHRRGAASGELLTVAPRTVVTRNERFIGVACDGADDGGFYWLPAREAGAFAFHGDEAERLFASRGMSRLKVVTQQGGGVSVLRQTAAAAEAERLALGASIFVDCTEVALHMPDWTAPHIADNWTLRACISKQSSATFLLAAELRHLERGSLQAEVAARQDGPRGPMILLTPANERLVVSEAPPWLFGAVPIPWSGETSLFLAPSTPIPSLSELVEALAGRAAMPDRQALMAAARAFIDRDWVGLLSGVALVTGLSQTPHGTMEREALAAVVRNLFDRSIRSLPLEPLAIRMLRGSDEETSFTAERVELLHTLFRGGRLDAARVAVDRWLSAIDLEGVKPDEEALASAFGLLLGRPGRAKLLIGEARFLSSVISATRAVGVSDGVVDDALHEAVRRLAQIGADLRDRQLDLPLLPPLQLF
jgi:hypothetical protein